MFKRVAILIGGLIYLGVLLVTVGIFSLNTKNWITFKTEFLKEKSSVVDHYMDNIMTGLENAVYSNAYWTEALVELESGNDEWIAVNATTYITDLGLFNIDYIFVGNESLSYTQESGMELGDEILQLSEVQDSLINNNVHMVMTKTQKGFAIVMSSPWMTNEQEEPTGVYVAMSLLDEDALLGLQNILGGFSVQSLEVVSSDQLLQNETITKNKINLLETYKHIDLIKPLLDSNYSLSMVFEMKSIHNIFSISRNYILTIVVLSASFVFALILLFVLFVEKRILSITNNVIDISDGNYDIHLLETKSTMFKEINELTNAVNRMSEDLKGNIQIIDNNYLEMAEVIIKAVEINDRYTSHHNIAVGVYAKILAEQIGYDNIQALELAAKLHDIGKISIPGSILNKPDKLTTEEFEIIKSHSIEGYNIIHHIEYFSEIRQGILYHHERWDGKGYPAGLKGEEIPLMAQIISIADVYDALTSDRAYRLGMSHEEAISIIVSNSSYMFNPILVEAFLSKEEMLEEELKKRRAIK